MSIYIRKLIENYPILHNVELDIKKSVDVLEKSFLAGNKLITCGNGGSSADAEHICGELVKGFIKKRKLSIQDRSLFDYIDTNLPDMIQGGLPAISLSVNHSTISAFNNDMNPDYVYAQQLWALGKEGDVFLGISTSGNSTNVYNAMKVAKAKKMKTILLSGQSTSRCSGIADITIHVPESETYRIQEYHLPIYHALCLEIEERLFDN